jgi:hypothetical protein
VLHIEVLILCEINVTFQTYCTDNTKWNSKCVSEATSLKIPFIFNRHHHEHFATCLTDTTNSSSKYILSKISQTIPDMLKRQNHEMLQTQERKILSNSKYITRNHEKFQIHLRENIAANTIADISGEEPMICNFQGLILSYPRNITR